VAVFCRIGDIDHKEGEVVTKNCFVVAPISLDSLFVKRGGVKLPDDFVDGFAQQLLGYLLAVVEANRKQHFVTP
jgi:hypothetical protein